MKTKTKDRIWIAALIKLKACEEAITWAQAGKFSTFAAAWKKCERADWMLWLLAKIDPKRTDLFPVTAAFVERALSHAADALDSAAGALGMPDESADALRKHSTALRGLKVNSHTAAVAARAAAVAASAAAVAASAAAWAAESKWQADYIRKHFATPDLP